MSYTYHNPRGRSDERIWARMAAAHAHCEHVELPMDPLSCRLEGLLNMQPSVAPMWGLQYLERSPLENQLAAENLATVVFTGEGGDSGFCSESLSHAATDYLSKHGFDLTAIDIAAHVARRSELTVWTVLAKSLRRWMFGYNTRDHQTGMAEVCRLVSTDVRECAAQDQHVHPWFHSTKAIPRPTILRLGTLVETPEFYDPSTPPSEPTPSVVSPLYSQPVIELFLQIPLYVHFYEGRERGLARCAFNAEVPEPILRRQWKDRAPGFFDELVLQNMPFIREQLLGGVLMQKGLLDKRATEEALSTSQSRTAYLPGEIMKHLDTELWARRWEWSSTSTAEPLIAA